MKDDLTRVLNLLARSILDLPRPIKRAAVLVLDAGLSVLSVWLAFYLRLGEWVPLTGAVWAPVLVSMTLALPIFITSGLYRAIFRYSGLPAMLALTRGMLVYGAGFAAVFTIWGFEGVPRTVGLIQPMLLLMMVGASRVAARVWLGGRYHQLLRDAALPQALIYGAGSAGRQLASAMANSSEIRVVGFLDDDERLHDQILNGLPIHNPADLVDMVGSESITDVLLALPSVSRQRRNEILTTLKPHRLAVRTLPGLSDLATGKVNFNDVRELDIDDLLSRDPVQPDSLLLNLNTRGKTVLVTGAGGSIGSELCRQILTTLPKRLLLLEVSEFALYQIHQELQAMLADDQTGPIALRGGDFAEEAPANLGPPQIEIVPLLGSVCDRGRMISVMSTWKPHTVYHAAAYKHVPIVEHNPAEGVRNNVWGTWVCAEAALRNHVRNFVLVSTDKAVRPTNIMGATKRLAEMVLQALAENMADEGSEKTVFSMVRFGNVLGSSGSVVPLFRVQIKNGGPVTLTHAEITRYFMTIPEAAQLVVQAGAMGQGGDVFVLDMGQPVKIIDLARRMIELSGLTVRDETQPDGDIALAITGLRPGEKLYEELLIGDNPQPTQHPRIMKAHEQFLDWQDLQKKLEVLGAAISLNDVSTIRAMLEDLVSGYRPKGEMVDWVHMALEREMFETSNRER